MTNLPKVNEPCWCGSGRKFKKCHKLVDVRVRPGKVTPMRSVPPEIVKPYYADTGVVKRYAEPVVRSDDVIERMRKSGRIAAEILEITASAITPGISTEELDVIAHEESIRKGVYPSTLNYKGYPKSICTSVNEVICHGIPDDRKLLDGDIINLDFTAFVDGVHGDTNATFFVGSVDEGSRKLVQVTRECLDLGIAAVRPGGQISDIGKAIEEHATSYGYGVIRDFFGHGVAEQFHCEPSIPHFFNPRMMREIEVGMTFTIEPMISIGSWKSEIWDDNWTAVTADGSRTAQFEHTMVVTKSGAEVLTVVEKTSELSAQQPL